MHFIFAMNVWNKQSAMASINLVNRHRAQLVLVRR